MAARTSLSAGRVDDIAQAAVDTMDAMNEAGLFQELEVAIDGHPVEAREQIDNLAVGQRAGRPQERGQDAAPDFGWPQSGILQHGRGIRTGFHGALIASLFE